jgi:hypothetical protein
MFNFLDYQRQAAEEGLTLHFPDNCSEKRSPNMTGTATWQKTSNRSSGALLQRSRCLLLPGFVRVGEAHRARNLIFWKLIERSNSAFYPLPTSTNSISCVSMFACIKLIFNQFSLDILHFPAFPSYRWHKFPFVFSTNGCKIGKCNKKGLNQFIG